MDITAAVTDTCIGTMVIVLTQGNMVISAADISIPAEDIGVAVIRVDIAADTITGDERNNSGLDRESIMTGV